MSRRYFRGGRKQFSQNARRGRYPLASGAPFYHAAVCEARVALANIAALCFHRHPFCFHVCVHVWAHTRVQGDVKFADCLEAMGATVTWGADDITVTRAPGVKLKGGTFDCLEIPDAAMTLAVVALFAEGPTRIENVYSWRLKETERMKAIVAECTKLGATVEEGRDYCVIHPPKQLNDNVLIETYDDHRMAMAFSLAACGGVSVIINDPGCTSKTFPTYFDVLDSVVSK